MIIISPAKYNAFVRKVLQKAVKDMSSDALEFMLLDIAHFERKDFILQADSEMEESELVVKVANTAMSEIARWVKYGYRHLDRHYNKPKKVTGKCFPRKPKRGNRQT